jgi:hypothetical protein
MPPGRRQTGSAVDVIAAAAGGWRDCPTGPWRTARNGPTPLFALFYQVEIRHRQLLP